MTEEISKDASGGWGAGGRKDHCSLYIYSVFEVDLDFGNQVTSSYFYI